MLLLALLGYLTLLASLLGATQGGARLAARLLDVEDFRWFDSEPARAAWWRRLGVRLISALGSLGVCVALFFCAYFFGGDRVSTTHVLVLPGPARDAGMSNGDRLVSIDGAKIDTWEAARPLIQARREHQIEIERAGTSTVLRVTPNAQGRIGVAPVERVVALGFVESVRRAAAQPFEVIGSTLRNAVDRGRPKARGPVGLVRETTDQADRKATAMIWALACYGAYFWPFLACFQVFEGATLWLFRKTHPHANRSEPFWRLARLQLALMLALACLAALLACVAVDEWVAWRVVTGPMILLLLPACFALLPLTWLAGNELWGVARSTIVVAVGLLVPGVIVLVALVLLRGTRRELGARGCRVGLLVVREQTEAWSGS